MLSEQIKTQIQQAYRAYLSSKGYRARQGQMQLIAHAARELTQEQRIAVAEAGTGTGKTLAYLLAGYFAAQAREKTLVISTATLALQEQLVLRDIPDFIKATGIELNYQLAKGRGRYLCLSRLELTLDEELQALSYLQSSLDLEPEQRKGAEAKVVELQQYMQDYAQGRWNGELDSLPQPPKPEQLAQMTASHRQCSQRRCQHFDSCAFYRARAKLEKAQLIVVNHDLLLSDLALGGGVVLPAPDDCLHILDEGHHLPDKALDHFAGEWHLDSFIEGASAWQKRLEQLKLDTLVLDLSSEVTELQSHVSNLQQQGQFLRTYLQQRFALSQGQRHRFVMGQIDDELLTLLQPSLQSLQLLVPLVDKVQRALLASIKEQSQLIDKSLVEL